MVKLYKKVNETVHYYEAWDNDGVVTVHWGELGTRGETRTLPIRFWQSAGKVIEKELAPARADGFSEIDFEDHIQFVLQYRVVGHGTEHDLEKRFEIENVLNEFLGWTGNGHCDGGQMGSGSMETFSYVVDPLIARETIVADLDSKGLIDGAVIAYRGREDDDYKVIFPVDYQGKFSLMPDLE